MMLRAERYAFAQFVRMRIDMIRLNMRTARVWPETDGHE